ncbi:zinc finger, CCHC-type containing protein [Tanacetum coccineum]
MAAAAMKHMASNFSKLDKFEGLNFRRWQKKMHFLLSSMSVVYVLTTHIPEDGGDDATLEQIRKIAKWDNDDYNVKSSKELWDSLEAKYMAEDASSKKFLVSNFIQDQSWNNIMNYLKDFKHTLKHKKEELTLIELGSHLRIEESLRVQDIDKPKGNNVAGPSVVNMVEYNNSSSNIKRDCKSVNVGNKANGSGTKGSVDGSSNLLKGQNMFNKSPQIYYVTYVSEAYFVQDDDDVAWWVDSGETVHVCKDRCWFKTYDSLNDGSTLHMGNESTALVHGRDCVDLRLYVIEPNDSVLINSIIESKDAIFDENRFSSVPKPKLEVLGLQTSWLQIDLQKKTKGIDYFSTYGLVARINTIRLLIAMASIHNLIIHQMDVKTTFLNGDLDEEFDEVVLSDGYLLTQADKCIYNKFDETGKGVIICLGYVDDMLIFGTDQVQVDLTKEFLSSRFSMKDMGEADVILVSNPMDISEKLMPNNGQVVSQREYSKVIGCLMYAMTCTRPDISFAVGKLSRYTSNTGTQHWQTIQPRFSTEVLKKTMDYRIEIYWLSSVLEGYTIAAGINNTKDLSSISGWLF